MVRKIIKINEEKCNGCGLCATACHEQAIEIVGGKAKLVRDDYCDGLGNCLPACPAGAITFEEREAAPYNEAAVKARQQGKNPESVEQTPSGCGCQSSGPQLITTSGKKSGCAGKETYVETDGVSQLRQWPVQIKLVPVNAPYFQDADLLIAADCAAYACGNFHQKFMENKITLIGCPKLDEGDYSEKLTAILEENTISSITVVRMEVSCCAGIVNAVKAALVKSGKAIPWQSVILSLDGNIT